MSSLFGELNKADVTAGLKTVTDDMKAKNRTDRTGVVGAVEPKSAPVAAKAVALPVAKPPKFALEGKKWSVEHQVDNDSMSVPDANMSQFVYMFKCSGKAKRSVLVVKNKINAVTIGTRICSRATDAEQMTATRQVLSLTQLWRPCRLSIPRILSSKSQKRSRRFSSMAAME